jgi:hypothetical protein
MNDSMSILLATTILALGGLGLYMYKSSDHNKEVENEQYNEDNIFGGNFWGFTDDKHDKEENTIIEEIDEDDYKPRKRGSKTQRNRRSNGISKRRY